MEETDILGKEMPRTTDSKRTERYFVEGCFFLRCFVKVTDKHFWSLYDYMSSNAHCFNYL